MFKNRKNLISISSLGGKKNSKANRQSKSSSPEVFCNKGVLKTIANIRRKTPALESLFNSYRSKVFAFEFCEMFKNT